MGLVPGLNTVCPMGPGSPGPIGGCDMRSPGGNPEPNGGGPM